MDSVKTIVTPETMSNVDSVFGASVGKSALVIDTSYVRAVLALLTAAAEQLKIKKIVTATTLEDPITYLLDEEMRVFQRANRSDIIRWVIQPNIKRDPTDPLLRCEPDFVFLWMDEEADPDLMVAHIVKTPKSAQIRATLLLFNTPVFFKMDGVHAL